ncbi:MAG: phosphoribosylanthranilate isomerase [Parasynechococcus sp.]
MSDTLTPPALKICGLTDVEQALAIAAMGVQAIGVIGVRNTARFVEPSRRREIFSALALHHPSINRVWVVADPNPTDLEDALAEEGLPTVVQLHGSETPARCAALQQWRPDIAWWKALRLREANDVATAKHYVGSVDALLLDAWNPNQLGGTGHRIPLDWISNQNHDVAWWLAGGISAEWVPDLLKDVSPDGLDASSRLEIEPGWKDLSKVKALVDAVRHSQGLQT